MKKILIDSNVLLDIINIDPVWFDWSYLSLVTIAEEYEICINPLIYAEMCFRFESPVDFDNAFPETNLKRLELPYAAAFLAAKAHSAYRRRGGSRISTLPDFFIGAHAAVSQLDLLTRDTRRYQTYFPSVNLISP